MAKGKIFDVKVRDIEKNPYRDYSTYGIQEDKIASLVESINETGFWETVIGRQKDEKVQIAFGHHRVEAARRVFKKPEDTIPIIIRELSDDMMRKMMVRENKTEYGCHPAAIDDAVKASRDHLEGHKDEARKALSSVRSEVKRVRVGAPAIAKDTGYPVTTVERSLQRLAWIEAGEVDKEALYKMPHQEAASRFARAVRLAKLPVGDQRRVAEKVAKDGKFGEPSIMETILSFFPMVKHSDPRSSGYFENQLRRATHLINEATRSLISMRMLNEASFTGGLPTDEDISEAAKVAFNKAVSALAERIEIVGQELDRNPEHGKVIFPEFAEGTET